MVQASFEPGTSQSRVLRSAVAPNWLGNVSLAAGPSFWRFLAISLKEEVAGIEREILGKGW